MLSDRQLLKKLGPVGHAFYGRFQDLREIQRQALMPILEGHNVLLASATASGKTEAVFAPLIARLINQQNLPPQGIRILAVAPTRALVNDLFKRLELPLSEISWTCGRQTADFSEKNKRPHVLLTTPESFDSLLVRGGKWEGNTLADHILASVRAVFLDEVHLYLSSPRGDQIVWLLARLRRLLNYAFSKAWRPVPNLQICAASATISQPQKMATKLLGQDAIVVQVAGLRELEIFTSHKKWQKIDNYHSIEDIYRFVIKIDDTNNLDALADLIWNVIENGEEQFCRKILIFVPTRVLCDRLSSLLADKLGNLRRMFIAGHHGSLEKLKREEAEEEFARRRDAILVATTTLEVGIDIGDVDAVVLVGPPSDTTGFLQRVGRAGRRADCVRIVAVARDELEARAFASLIHSASKGELEQVDEGRRWSVFVQQTASYVAQSGKKGRRRSDLFQLVSEVWPEPEIAQCILNHLIEKEFIIEQAGRLFLGEEFTHKLEEGRGSLHHNFESDFNGLPVIDACTGDVIARVSGLPQSQGPVALAGQRWQCSLLAGEIILKPSSEKKTETSFRYAARGTPVRKSFAEHIRAGLGLAPYESPVIRLQGSEIWFHFGGYAYEQVLFVLYKNLSHIEQIRGIAVLGKVNQIDLQTIASDERNIIEKIKLVAHKLSFGLDMGKYHKFLPENIKSDVIVDLFNVKNFIFWLRSIKLINIDSSHFLYDVLKSLVQ